MIRKHLCAFGLAAAAAVLGWGVLGFVFFNWDVSTWTTADRFILTYCAAAGGAVVWLSGATT